MTRFKREIQRLWLKKSYRNGQRHSAQPEPHSPELIQLGNSLRLTAQSNYLNQFQGGSYRILLCTPPSMAAAVWFSDLSQGLKHMGVHHKCVPAGTPIDQRLLDGFSPNVVIALDHNESLRFIDLTALEAHKRENGCLRLFIPSRVDLLHAQSSLSPPDAARLQLAKSGKIADAYCSLYDTAVFNGFYGEWAKAGFPYLSIPQACNPLEDHPSATDKDSDWFCAVINNPARLASVWSHLRPILSDHKGIWIDGGWGFGSPIIKPAEMTEWYGRAKISLAPLIDFLRLHPAELSHRVFEAAACGAFQITSLSPLTRDFFSQKALVAVEHPADFKRAFEYWLPRVDERNRVAEHALIEVYAKHTVYHRVEKLVDFLDQHHHRF